MLAGRLCSPGWLSAAVAVKSFPSLKCAAESLIADERALQARLTCQCMGTNVLTVSTCMDLGPAMTKGTLYQLYASIAVQYPVGL